MNEYIQECMKNHTKVCVYIVNGFQCKGTIQEEGQDYIVLECGRARKMIYKHAISTIEPQI